jgi:hypothetical protein
MMQNSLERIFAGLCATLRESVLPEVADPWARTQVEAAVGLLANLGARVEWRCADLREEVRATREVLAAAVEADRSSPALALARSLLDEPVAVDADGECLARSRAAHLRALADVQAWLAAREDGEAAPVRAALGRLLVDRLDAELALLGKARRATTTSA